MQGTASPGRVATIGRPYRLELPLGMNRSTSVGAVVLEGTVENLNHRVLVGANGSTVSIHVPVVVKVRTEDV